MDEGWSAAAIVAAMAVVAAAAADSSRNQNQSKNADYKRLRCAIDLRRLRGMGTETKT